MNKVDVKAKIKELRKTIPLLHWGCLRFVGSLRVLSVSYIIGAIVALLNLIGTDLTVYLRNTKILLSITIYVVFISLANLIYYFFCPVIIKKFENLPDFYEHQLNIKRLQLDTYPSDPFDANLLHVAEHYITALGSSWGARVISLVLFVIGFIALIFFAVNLYAITLSSNCV